MPFEWTKTNLNKQIEQTKNNWATYLEKLEVEKLLEKDLQPS